MVRNLPDDDDEGRRVRQQLDSDLDTFHWRVPGLNVRAPQPRAASTEPAPPAWWHGDEEASQIFLQAMGVNVSAGA
jgi:hypothetical protein